MLVVPDAQVENVLTQRVLRHVVDGVTYAVIPPPYRGRFLGLGAQCEVIHHSLWDRDVIYIYIYKQEIQCCNFCNDLFN